ncbi:TPA: hypothetical protein PXD14_006370 [Pseudomonas aeruginosa]|nr:hypothetical protein [Pseudomonas aeruginosa]ELM3811429.1 hypothetical protein [Pseudomonas aeruginosa]HDL5089362.1 hypothetical protein [Pseudomonas aeruginosa]
MTDHAELRRLAEACDVSRCADEGEERRRLHDFYDCIEPELILSMLNEIAENDSVVAVWRGRTQRTEEERDRLKAELEQSASVLPGNYYMDPPDGGNVSIPEQIRRMAKDAARYRWLRERDLETIRQGGVFAGMTPENIVLNQEDLDAEIDAALEGATQ